MKILALAAMLGGAALLSACSPAGTISGAGATIARASMEERGLEKASEDAAIQIAINDKWFKHDFDMFRQVDMTVREQRVLLTGVVPNPQARVDAVRLAWQTDGVKEVINEIKVSDSYSWSREARDALTSESLRWQLMFDSEVSSVNYTVDVVDGVIYLMGVARDPRELQRVMSHARGMDGIKNVVSHVRVREPAPPQQTTRQ